MTLDCDEIIPGRLWVGSFIRPSDVEQLHRMLITTVFSLQSREDLNAYDIPLEQLAQSCDRIGLRLIRVPIQDFDPESLSANLPAAVAELECCLEPTGSRVYLHCTAGINRSPTVASAYLMRSAGLSPAEACEYLIARRRCTPCAEALERYDEYLSGQHGNHARQDS